MRGSVTIRPHRKNNPRAISAASRSESLLERPWKAGGSPQIGWPGETNEADYEKFGRRLAADRLKLARHRRKPTGVMAITARGGGAITGLRMTEALGVAAVAGTSTAMVLATATPARPSRY
jgi:hypothetical protein